MNSDQPLVMFDGVCNLCNGTVTFLLDHDAQHRLHFLSLQSPKAQRLLPAHDQALDLSSICFLEEDRLYVRSTAVLRLARYLKRPWKYAAYLLWIPRPLRDAVYGVIARGRPSYSFRNEGSGARSTS